MVALWFQCWRYCLWLARCLAPVLLLQVPPGGTNFQFRDPTEGRHAVYNALTSKDNPRPLPQDHYALAIGVQTFCLGGAGIFTAPDMAGPWTYRGSLFNQIAPEPDVSGGGGNLPG